MLASVIALDIAILCCLWFLNVSPSALLSAMELCASVRWQVGLLHLLCVPVHSMQFESRCLCAIDSLKE